MSKHVQTHLLQSVCTPCTRFIRLLLLARHSGSHKADHLHGPAKHWDIVTSSHSVILSHSESVWSVEIYRIYLLSPLRPICTLLSHFQGSTENHSSPPNNNLQQLALLSHFSATQHDFPNCKLNRFGIFGIFGIFAFHVFSHVLFVGALQGRILRLPLGRAADAFSRFSVKEVC